MHVTSRLSSLVYSILIFLNAILSHFLSGCFPYIHAVCERLSEAGDYIGADRSFGTHPIPFPARDACISSTRRKSSLQSESLLLAEH